VLRRIFRRNRAEVTGGRKKLHTEELHNLYCSSDIKIIKSRRMRCAGDKEDEKCIQHFGWKV
jgi:hypothetical protein